MFHNKLQHRLLAGQEPERASIGWTPMVERRRHRREGGEQRRQCQLQRRLRRRRRQEEVRVQGSGAEGVVAHPTLAGTKIMLM